MARQRPERDTLPGIARVRVVGDDDATRAVLDVLAQHFTTTAPAPYSGGRHYLDIDTRAAATAENATPVNTTGLPEVASPAWTPTTDRPPS
jgi:hypothetical protein